MKMTNLLLWVSVAGVTAGFAQSVPSSDESASRAPAPPMHFRATVPTLTDQQIAQIARFQNDTVSRVLGVNLQVDGVIPRALRTRHPLQLINPLSPPEYGNGLDNVTTDPQTGQANGIRFLSLKF